MTVFTGYIPPNTEMHVGDYTTSPSGLYYGMLDAGGNFWVMAGSNPTVAPCCGYGPSPPYTGYQVIANNFNTNNGGFFAHMQTDGNFVVYTSSNGQDQGPANVVIGSTQTANLAPNGPYFAQVSDKGNFNLFQGDSPTNYIQQLTTDGSNVIGALKSIDLTKLEFDFSNAVVSSPNEVSYAPIITQNFANSPDQGNASTTLTWTQSQSFSFNVTNTTSLSIGSTVQVGVPGIGSGSTTVTFIDSTAISQGQATTTSKTVSIQAGDRPTIPPHSAVITFLFGTEESYTVPYTWEGTATYEGLTPTQEGTTAKIVGTGMFSGGTTGNFRVQTFSCVTIDDCSLLPLEPISEGAAFIVPEPGLSVLLPAALLLGRLRARRRSRRPARV